MIQIDMKMPRSCVWCRFLWLFEVSEDKFYYLCKANRGTSIDKTKYKEQRMSWCPLQEVKE